MPTPFGGFDCYCEFDYTCDNCQIAHDVEEQAERERLDEAKYPKAVTHLLCADCGNKLELRESPKFGPFYGCSSYPSCKGSLSANPDGSPKGSPADAATKKARVDLHRVFDRIWQDGDLVKNRGAAYEWLRTKLGIPWSKAKISSLTKDQCEHLMREVYLDFPRIRRNRYEFLLVDTLGDE